jgi:hypothetical protein
LALDILENGDALALTVEGEADIIHVQVAFAVEHAAAIE